MTIEEIKNQLDEILKTNFIFEKQRRKIIEQVEEELLSKLFPDKKKNREEGNQANN